MKYRKSTATVAPFTAAQTQRVMQRVYSLDFIGPVDEDELGYKYVLTVIDNFSRWVMTYPCKTIETELVRNLIVHFGIFGLPLEFLTDNGSNLKAELVEDICNMLRIDHKFSVAYLHEEM